MERTRPALTTLEMTVTALFAAIIAGASQLTIFIGLVPLSFGIFAVMLCAAILPLRTSFAAVLVYLMVGAVGAPVFAGFHGGIQRLAGPTGGYLIGYIALVLIVGILDKRRDAGTIRLTAYLIFATLVFYVFGTAWLAVYLNSIADAFLVGVAPFILLDIARAALAAIVGLRLRRAIGL